MILDELNYIQKELKAIAAQSAQVEATENISQEERQHSREAIYRRAAHLQKLEKTIIRNLSVTARIVKSNRS